MLGDGLAGGRDLPLEAYEVVEGEVEGGVVLGAAAVVGLAPVADDDLPRDEPEEGVEDEGRREGEKETPGADEDPERHGDREPEDQEPDPHGPAEVLLEVEPGVTADRAAGDALTRCYPPLAFSVTPHLAC